MADLVLGILRVLLLTAVSNLMPLPLLTLLVDTVWATDIPALLEVL